MKTVILCALLTFYSELSACVYGTSCTGVGVGLSGVQYKSSRHTSEGQVSQWMLNIRVVIIVKIKFFLQEMDGTTFHTWQ